MKRLIFIKDSYKLNIEELEKFIAILKIEDLLDAHLPYLEKKIQIDELFFLLKSRYICKNHNQLIYQNLFTKEKITILFIKDKIYLNGENIQSSFYKQFYKTANNFIIIDDKSD